MKVTSLDSSVSWESIYVYFKTEKLKKHKLNHYEADQNRKISLFSLLTGEHEMTRELKYANFKQFQF